jgi:hypothetical protein
MDKPSVFENVRNFSQEHGYFLTHGVQSVIDAV